MVFTIFELFLSRIIKKSPLQSIIDLFRFIAFGQTILLIFLLIKSPNKRLYVWSAVFLGACVAAYLLAYWPPIAETAFLFFVILPFSIAIPLSFWIFAKTIFDDEFRWQKSYSIGVVSIVIIHTALFLLNGFIWSNLDGDSKIIAYLPPYLLSIFFVFMGLLEAVKNYQTDLVSTRLRFRFPFIVISAIIMLITLASLMALQHDNLPLVLELIQKIGIASLTFYFSIHQLKLDTDFFQEDKAIQFLPEIKSIDEQLLSSLMHQIDDEKIYKTEGLTIRKLAELMEVKEYKLRQVINQHLGFRNFNEFINKYRIIDANKMLLANGEKAYNVTEIAFELGYTSLSPFNKAFKQINGMTPTAYRKQHIKH